METAEQISLENLQRTSQNWDKRTKNILLHISGAGNMFGGHSRLLHITLHGENSIYETGSVTINGVARAGYNISRGANGENSQIVSYYAKVEDFDDIDNKKSTFEINITGACGGGKEALCQILHAEQDWIK